MRQTASEYPTKVPTCPAWASQIEVVRQGESLIVTGWNRWQSYPCHADLPKGSDLLWDYDCYVKGGRDVKPLHLALVDAADDQRLEAFVRKFGPLSGGHNITRLDEHGTMDLTVIQPMLDLRSKQYLFRKMFELVAELREERFTAHVASNIANCAMVVERFEAYDVIPSELMILDMDAKIAMYEHDWAAAYTAGHSVACRVFELFPSRLIPYPDGPVELPQREPDSVLSEAMFMLRNDYMQRWKLSFCKNPNCLQAFRLTRKDQTCCDTVCASAVRSRKYYDRRGYKVRRARLAAKKAGIKRN